MSSQHRNKLRLNERRAMETLHHQALALYSLEARLPRKAAKHQPANLLRLYDSTPLWAIPWPWAFYHQRTMLVRVLGEMLPMFVSAGRHFYEGIMLAFIERGSHFQRQTCSFTKSLFRHSDMGQRTMGARSSRKM